MKQVPSVKEILAAMGLAAVTAATPGCFCGVGNPAPRPYDAGQPPRDAGRDAAAPIDAGASIDARAPDGAAGDDAGPDSAVSGDGRL